MTTDRARRLVELFDRLVELAPEARGEVMDRECGEDRELRARLERMLRDDESPASLLDEFDGMRELERADPMVGRVLGVYRLTERIARGGMGVVYRAVRTDGLFDRDVAIKLVRRDAVAEESRRRFALERQALARLDHEHIARLYDAGTTEEGDSYFVMEFVEGRPVDGHCDEEGLDVRARLRTFVKICRAVHFAHQNLVVHRDLKPSNILVDTRGEPKLLDFGIARILAVDEDESEEARHRTLTLVLTPEYASPEQLTGASITTATDIYSLGVVLYGLLTGGRPFRLTSTSPMEWHRQVSERAPTRPSSSIALLGASQDPSAGDVVRNRATSLSKLRRSLAGDLDRIVLTTLRKEPSRRYASAGELADDIERHLEGLPIHAREDSLWYLTSRFVSRHRVVVAAGFLVFGALVVGLVAARRGERLAQDQANHARIEASSLQRMSAFLTDTFLGSRAVLGDEQRRSAAEDIQRYATTVRIEHAGQVHLRANLLDSLGKLATRLDLFAASEALIREAFELREGEFGGDSIEVALSMGSLGELAYRRGDYARAVDDFGAALHLHRTCPPNSHTDVAVAANNLAVALRNVGRVDEAEALHREALALRNSSAKDSEDVAESLNNLAGILLERGDYQDARPLLERALEIRARVLGEDALNTAQSRANLAQVAWGLSEFDLARQLLERAEAAFRQLGARGRGDLATSLVSLAALDTQSGDIPTARERLFEALDIQISDRGAEHPDVATALVSLAIAQRALGESAEARASLEEALRIRREALPEASPLVGRTLQELGAHLLGMGLAEEAEAHLRESVETLGARPITHELWLARAEAMLGACLVRLERVNEARTHLLMARERMKRLPGAGANELDSVRRRLESLGEVESDS